MKPLIDRIYSQFPEGWDIPQDLWRTLENIVSLIEEKNESRK